MSLRLRRRERNGRYQRRGAQEREFAPAAVMRARTAAINGVLQAEWASEAGRLFLYSRLSAVEYSAARKWSEQAVKHHLALGCRPVRSATLELGVHSHEPDPDSDRGRALAAVEARERRRFEAAARVLEASGCRSVVDRVVLQDEAPAGHEELQKLKHGLQALAGHWGLARKNGHER